MNLEIPKELLRDILKRYIHETLGTQLPELVREIVLAEGRVQDCIPIAVAMNRYDLSRQTLYNYHQRQGSLLYSSGGRTFVSVQQLEAYIKKHPLNRNLE